jgi:hypothetical protein
MTGEDARKTSSPPEIFQGLDIISGPIIESFLLQNNTKAILLHDEFMQVSLMGFFFRNTFGNAERFTYTRILQTTKSISMQRHHRFICQYAPVAQGNDSSWAIDSSSTPTYHLISSASLLGQSRCHQMRRSSLSCHPRVDRSVRSWGTVRRYTITPIPT